jgi:hypothetical protein
VVQAPAAGTSSSSGAAAPAASHPTLRPPAAAEDTAPSLPGLAPPDDYPFLAPPQGPDELGRLGTYRVLKVLGTGAMGVVFQAEDPSLKRLVALKVLKPSLAASAEFHRRFLREAQLAAALDHEHVVTIYQVGEDRGIPFLAMQLLQGETLEERLRRAGGALRLPALLRLGREIAEGLGAAHAKGLVHRDIKPANIWLEAGRDRVGTPAYMAPEQANGEQVDARCDLFSLGAVLYRAATGAQPFAGKDTLSVLRALATETPEPPHKIAPSLPRAFSGLVMRLLAKDRNDRPQSAREVVEAIAAIERGESTEAAPASPREPAEAARGRTRGTAAPLSVPAAEGVREKEAAGAGVKRREPKKARHPAARRKKRHEAGRDWGRLVLVASLVLLGVAVLVLLFAVIWHATQARAAASADHTAIQAAGLLHPRYGFRRVGRRPVPGPRPQLSRSPQGGADRAGQGAVAVTAAVPPARPPWPCSP